MVWYRRLRWRLVGIQLLVVAIGVASVLLATRLLILEQGTAVIRPTLTPHIDSPTLIATIEAEILAAFGAALNTSLLIAGLGALLAGGIASFLLWRTLVLPLRRIAGSSQRIADGHYAERVPLPQQGGEALQQVVTNFNQMATWLEDTEKQRAALVGNVAHELRTPLAGLRGLIEGIEDGIYSPDAATFQDLSRELNRLSRLVDDLQNLSKIEAGAFQLDYQAVNLEEIVQRVLTHLKPQADGKGVELQVVLADGERPLVVWADADRSAQVLTNLISNAIRYTPSGGEVTLTLTRQSGSGQVAVADSGVGIAAENLPHLFERFYRVDTSRSRHSGGSGIGLTIARHLTWAMGGSLAASSPGEGQGSTFTLTLPLAVGKSIM